MLASAAVGSSHQERRRMKKIQVTQRMRELIVASVISTLSAALIQWINQRSQQWVDSHSNGIK